MKSTAFAYERPASIEEAIASKASWGAGARFLAGGQSLVPALNMRLNQPECLIDLNRVAGLRGIERDGDGIVIGALARHAEVLASPVVRTGAPVLLQAGRHLAHAAIRNRGTFGGSVALADPAAEWPAACVLLDARMRIRGASGVREVDATDFFQGLYTTALGEDELLESVRIRCQAPDEKGAVIEVARRHGDFASAAVITLGRVMDGRLSSLRMVFFAVADTPLHDPRLDEQVTQAVNGGGAGDVEGLVKQALSGRELRADLYTAAATKRHLCGVLARRATQQLLEGSKAPA